MTNDDADNPGKSAEDLVERICHRAFFRDFVARDPEFRNPGGKVLEAADVLVLFGDEALTIQVKARPHARKDTETRRSTSSGSRAESRKERSRYRRSFGVSDLGNS